MADVCHVCRVALPHGRDMTWPAIFGLFFGHWRGHVWMCGFVHSACADVLVQRWDRR